MSISRRSVMPPSPGSAWPLLPDHTCRGELASGRLVHVFPQWRTEDGIVHLVFTTRRGLPPVVRAFIDHLAGAFRNGNVAS